MIQKINSLILMGFLTLGLQGFLFAQDLKSSTINKIEKEISKIFEKSIEAGEKLDITEISENINDTLKAGFIDNGLYFKSFDDLMVGFKKRINGLENQTMTIVSKKTTVLSENIVLLTANGNFSAKRTDGRVFKGKFAWTFVYSKLNGSWKVIHSHMSTPKS